MNVGDRVMLTAKAAAGINKRQKLYTLDWSQRVGTYTKRHTRGLVGVIWDGRVSLDWFPEYALQIAEETPPQPEPGPAFHGKRATPRRHRRGRRDVL